MVMRLKTCFSDILIRTSFVFPGTYHVVKIEFSKFEFAGKFGSQ